MNLLLLPIILILRLLIISLDAGVNFIQAVSWNPATIAWHHQSQKLTENDIKILMQRINNNQEYFNRTLNSILIPRVPGSENHKKVKQYIIKSMNELNWTVEEDAFTNSTPHGKKPFTNIIATYNPLACRRLVLACHYDSLIIKKKTFVGATDSAVPCAMMINLAKILDKELRYQQQLKDILTLQMIFFDGEEAFERWSKTDSLYGSRHLAKLWNTKKFPQGNNDEYCKNHGDFVSFLDRMDVLVLLDLIGAPNPTFYSYFLDTHSLYMELVDIEQKLNHLKYIESHPPETKTTYFSKSFTLARIEDDHIPFMKKNVPILHIIPSPFPSVWHQESDNSENLHHPTINNLNKIIVSFVAEYLRLHPNEEQVLAM